MDNSGHTLHFPSKSKGWGRNYQIEGSFVSTADGLTIRGDGLTGGRILWTPTDEDQTFFTSKPKGAAGGPDQEIYVGQGGIQNITLEAHPSASEIKKTLWYFEDMTGFLVNRVRVVGFNAVKRDPAHPERNASIIFKIAGRDTSAFSNLDLIGARPFVFIRNPREPKVGLDADYIRLHDISTACVGSGFPVIDFEDGAYPYNLAVRDMVGAGGSQFIRVNSGVLTQPQGVILDNCRHEQVTPGDGTQYSFDIVGNEIGVIQRVAMRECKNDSTCNGIRLKHVRSATIDNHKHIHGASRVALNLDMVGICELRAGDLGGLGRGKGNTLVLAENMRLKPGSETFRLGEAGIPSSATYQRIS